MGEQVRKGKEEEEVVVRRFYLGASSFSVYEEMGRQLRAAGWTAVSKAAAPRCDLLLGDRFHIPYSTLRSEPVASASYFGGRRWVNYFEDSSALTRKVSMTQLLRTMDERSAEWLPLSFIVGGAASPSTAGSSHDEREGWAAAALDEQAAVWIVKPNSGAKGKHITIVRGPDGVAGFLASINPFSKTVYVAQRYVDRPLLLSHGRKFDIRVWVLLVSPYRIYAFSQCSCRTAGTPFSLADLSDTAAHLTNHCVQEHAPHYGAYEEGNEMWLPDLRAYLEGAAPDGGPVMGVTGAVERVLLPQVSNIIVRSLLCLKNRIEVLPEEPFRCFQLFGYDVMSDADGHVWLLEINGSPGIAERFLTPLVQEMMGLIVAPAAATAAEPVEVSRVWDIEASRMVLLWQEGDVIPPGLPSVE